MVSFFNFFNLSVLILIFLFAEVESNAKAREEGTGEHRAMKLLSKRIIQIFILLFYFNKVPRYILVCYFGFRLVVVYVLSCFLLLNFLRVTEEVANETEKNLADEKPAGEEEAADGNKETVAANETEEKEPEDKVNVQQLRPFPIVLNLQSLFLNLLHFMLRKQMEDVL